ncbi:hypothetical protein [Sporosarcina highlanderae]|uniref:Uncharacterized protein n=1 Tax=Sporosarcina highlanderae TaxID=3035916 RepID=A0ABT8JLA2_9BACL|nr:hypothetical protein [Sporosarcina highlanderae]MDN4605920.1 hypothetical protein [Sporosarcina highlanderae]
MKSVDQNIVARQYFSNLPPSRLECPLVNYAYEKLTEYSLVKALILADIMQWRSWETFEKGIRLKAYYKRELEVASISGSHLSRRLAGFDTFALADLLAAFAKKVLAYTLSNLRF